MAGRVLVTGASGFIGREVVPLLCDRGFEVHCIGRTLHPDPRARHHRCDLLDDAQAAQAVRAVAATHLVHLAWYAEPGRFWEAPENLDWLAASLRLVRNFAEAGGRRALVAGSCAEYDWSAPLLDETATPLRPATLYGEAKAALYHVLERGSGTLGLSVLWARIFFPFGPFERRERLLGSLIQAARAGATADFSAGTQQRDFMHVEDVAAALVAALESEAEGAVNIASGECVAIRAVVEQAAGHMNALHLPRFGNRPLQPGEPPRLEAATDRLHREIGFHPRFDLNSGLADAMTRGVAAARL